MEQKLEMKLVKRLTYLDTNEPIHRISYKLITDMFLGLVVQNIEWSQYAKKPVLDRSVNLRLDHTLILHSLPHKINFNIVIFFFFMRTLSTVYLFRIIEEW